MHSIDNARSARFVSLAAAVLLLSLTTLGCKINNNATIGAPCDFDSDCSGLDGGFCTADGICSRPCFVHEDCGCDNGTTTSDIALGACDTSCNFSLGMCTRLCSSTAECANLASCGPYDSSLYLTCL
jgi:hypothetical protein